MAKAVAPQTLSGSIAAADEHVTILDDKAEVEDDAVFHWLKGHRIWSQGGHGFALVVDPALPQPWRNKALAFKTEDEARAYLMKLRPNASTIRVLTAVAGPLPPAQKPVPKPLPCLS